MISSIKKHWVAVLGVAVLGLLLVAAPVQPGLAAPAAPVLTATVQDQQCQGGDRVNVTLTATLSPPKSGVRFSWDFNNDGIFDTAPNPNPTVTTQYPDEVNSDCNREGDERNEECDRLRDLRHTPLRGVTPPGRPSSAGLTAEPALPGSEWPWPILMAKQCRLIARHGIATGVMAVAESPGKAVSSTMARTALQQVSDPGELALAAHSVTPLLRDPFLRI